MGDFFNGWRRKAGCVMLLLALGFMGGWVRSLIFRDTLILRANGTELKNVYFVNSDNGFIKLVRWYGATEFTFVISGSYHTGRSGQFHFMDRVPRSSSAKMTTYILPYACFVIPLTLLSAYLLLTKPRIAKSIFVSENVVPDYKGLVLPPR